MRLKEFIITIAIFTVFYILFFIVFDKIAFSVEQKNKKKKMDSLLSEKKYTVFAQFYGLQTIVSREVLERILNDIRNMPSISISSCSETYQLTPYEFVVAVLYLEYFQLIGLREVYLQSNVMIPMRQKYVGIVSQYKPLFANKLSYEEIVQQIGQVAINELGELNQLFLIPGVRIINSKMYYVGDINEIK